MTYDNTNRWTLNKNPRKEQPNHPDYKGSINVDGQEYWLDGWIKDGANGKFISGSIKLKEARTPDGSQGAPMQREELDDDVPFISNSFGLEHRVG